MLEKFAMNEDVFGNPLISRQLFLLRLMGYIYSVNDSFQFLHFVRGFFSSAVIGIFAASQICGIWLNFDNLEMFVLSVGICIMFTNIITRIIIFYRCNKEYKSLISKVDIGLKHVLETSLPAEMKIFNQYQKYITTLTYSFCVPGILGISGCTVEALYFLNFRYDDWLLSQESNGTESSRMPILYILYPMGNLWTNYYFAFISPFAAICVGVMALVAWHTFNASLMRYISFRLDVIKYKISNMQEYVNFLLRLSHQSDTRSSHSLIGRSDNVFRYVIISCVKDYQEIKSFSKKYEIVTSSAVFIESATYSILVCFLLYVISQVSLQGTDLIVTLLYKDFSAGYGSYEFWCTWAIQILFLYYWHGNEILDKSNGITNAIYSLNWYEFPVTFQKDILILMTATMKPIMLKAGLFYINTGSFAMILKTSYSYFMLLRKLAE